MKVTGTFSAAACAPARIAALGSENRLTTLDLATPHDHVVLRQTAASVAHPFSERRMLRPRPPLAESSPLPVAVGRLSAHGDVLVSVTGAAYHLGPIIGQGGYACVRLANRLGAGGPGQLVAIKEFVLARLAGACAKPKRLEFAVREYRIMRAAGSTLAAQDVICTYKGREPDRLFAVLPPLLGDALDISELLRAHAPQSMALWARHVLCALVHQLVAVGDSGFVHADIKPENILLDAAGELHLGDYGLAAPTSKLQAARGSLEYAAPEQLKGHFTESADIYSAAVCVIAIMAGNPLYNDDNDVGMMEALSFRRSMRYWVEAELAGEPPPRGIDRDTFDTLDCIMRQAQAMEPVLFPVLLSMLNHVPSGRPKPRQLVQAIEMQGIALTRPERRQVQRLLLLLPTTPVAQQIARALRN